MPSVKVEKDKYKFIPGVILDDADEEVVYGVLGYSKGDKCSRCPLRGICG
ncbi:MAG: hypothetical protein OWQ48_02825 [Desulfurococcus sp.]|nr:hypothetical protein [Desulfurococcus sp.]